jgi:hypothetical protein
MNDLERAMQRMTMMERRLERLETLVKEKVGEFLETEPLPGAGSTAQRIRPERAGGGLSFPEIHLQLVEPPALPTPKSPRDKVSKARAAVEQLDHLIAPLSTLWGHPEFDRFINRLIMDDRGNRRGFGPEVMEELLFLAQLNHLVCPNWRPCDPWEDAQFIGDRI